MTLCIAVACEHEDEPRIVLCNDWREESLNIGSSEHTDKQSWIADGWPVLTAGTTNQIEDLLRLYRHHLAKTALDENNFMDELNEPAKQYKGALAENYMQRLLGVPYTDFLTHGKERYPDEFFRDKISEISRITIQASLIIAGFIHGSAMGDIRAGLFPVICIVDDNDSNVNVVREEVHFASIGSGLLTANAALYNRGANHEMPVLAAIYAVFEAHRLSERVPGVGESLSIDVLEPDGILRGLSGQGYDYCEFLWRKFGPKEIREKQKGLFNMKEDFLEKT